MTPVVVLFARAAFAGESAPQATEAGEIDLGEFYAKGDGLTDDTVAVQRALTHCSNHGVVCRIAGDRRYLITRPLFLWGHARLEGNGGSGGLVFNIPVDPYLVNLGIRGRNELAAPFTGTIAGVSFSVIGGQGGRILYFWRTRGATIEANTFDVGEYAYSATSSGNDNNWVRNGFANCVREDIRIVRNRVRATAGIGGGEGIGLGSFDRAEIAHNEIVGVGDDAIGIHFSSHVSVSDNVLKSVHGRLFVSNSVNVSISGNSVERIPSPSSAKFIPGIALVYVGFENQDGNSWVSPRDIRIVNNRLYYPAGALDQGAAINLNGVKATTVEGNRITNDSSLVIATALHLSPVLFSGVWIDPEGVEAGAIASVWDVSIRNNDAQGRYPQEIVMSGNCVNYRGRVIVDGNSARGFTFYCDRTDFSAGRNIVRGRLP